MERREYERKKADTIDIQIEIIECLHVTHRNVDIVINEVSKKGLRFRTMVELVVDEIIHFHLPSLSLSPYLTGRIAWKKALAPDDFEYGFDLGSFIDLIPSADRDMELP